MLMWYEELRQDEDNSFSMQEMCIMSLINGFCNSTSFKNITNITELHWFSVLFSTLSHRPLHLLFEIKEKSNQQ